MAGHYTPLCCVKCGRLLTRAEAKACLRDREPLVLCPECRDDGE